MRNKLISKHEASLLASRCRRKGEKVIACSGTFDILHPGHISFLERAKKKGDIVDEWGMNCIERNIVEKNGGKIVVLKKIGGYSTTSVLKRAMKSLPKAGK